MNDWYEAERRVERAEELLARQQWPEAVQELRAALAIHPHNTQWLIQLGRALDEMGSLEEAVAVFRRALELEPDHIESLYRTGICLARLGRPDEALVPLERIEQVEPGFERAYCHRILLHAQLQDHERAEEVFYLARQYREQCPHCYHNIAVSLAARGLLDKAIYCWQRTLDIDSDYPSVHQRLAEAWWRKGQLEKARQHYLHELRNQPGALEPILDLGRLLLEMGRFDESGEKFRRGVELAPESAAAQHLYGCWLTAAGRLDEAIDALERSLRLDPTHPASHLQLGRLLLARGQKDAAAQHLRAELVLGPRDHRLLLELSNRLLDCGEHRPAVAALRRLVDLHPEDAAGWHNLGVAHFLAGRYAEGIGPCLHALKLKPTMTVAMYNLALAFRHMQDYDLALRWARRAVSSASHDASLRSLELRLRLMRGWDRLCRGVRRLAWWR